MDRIDILLATYNGAAFLDQQLESIEAQTHENWRLIARDDGSTDATSQFLTRFYERHPDKVVVLKDAYGNLGVVGNFSHMMESSTAPYVAFCDQDDVWKSNKLEISLKMMRQLEKTHGMGMPLLVFTDLTVVSENLDVVCDSFWRSQKLRPERCNSFNRLLVQNVVTGCTALMNRSLKERVIPIPPEADVHDWWLALVAAAFGIVAYVPQSTVLYRQHVANAIGARILNFHTLPGLLSRLLSELLGNKPRVLSRYSRAAAFRDRFGETLDESERVAIGKFLEIGRVTIAKRAAILVRYKMQPVGFIRSMLFLILARDVGHMRNRSKSV